MTSTSSTITVLYFAAAQTAVGLDEEVIALPSDTVPVGGSLGGSIVAGGFPLSSLAALLIARHPDTKLADALKDSRWSVDEEMVEQEEESSVLLNGGEVVAVICPVSGG